MHPLPRTDELAYELDADPRAVYFEQAAAGVPVRMALIAWLLENGPARTPDQAPAPTALRFKAETAPRCNNPNCITPPRRPLTCARAFGLAPRGQPIRRCCCAAISASANCRSSSSATPAARYYRFDESLLGYVRQLDRGRHARGFRQRQAGRGGGLRALPARPAARNHERRRDRRARSKRSPRKSSRDLPDFAAVSDRRRRQPRRAARRCACAI